MGEVRVGGDKVSGGVGEVSEGVNTMVGEEARSGRGGEWWERWK